MSLTTTAKCWNQRSFERLSTGIGSTARRQVLLELDELVSEL